VTRFLGLDLATNTGWALVEDGKVIGSGIRKLRYAKGEHSGEKYRRFFSLLTEMWPVDEIYYELIQFSGARRGGGSWSGDSGETYKGLLAITLMYAAGMDVPVHGVHPATLKKDFTGYGRAEKEDMCRIAHKLGWSGGSRDTALHHDEADAIALLVTQLKQRYGVAVSF
jgi:hypothetical protein